VYRLEFEIARIAFLVGSVLPNAIFYFARHRILPPTVYWFVTPRLSCFGFEGSKASLWIPQRMESRLCRKIERLSHFETLE
jgi:hypothetical protein